ncbi:uncharacterized protein LOC124266655 [Haliotis rubra]|uniref:uncharacterized protein LOC124266655 n=1 Tax=Haliotis rubra TaxID=36100 RepID=UPI001EE5BBF7|nr:uncharacterized protein LOC124266655 [Haliotis rubra]
MERKLFNTPAPHPPRSVNKDTVSIGLGLSIQDGNGTCADCTAFFTDRQEMTLERINEEEEKMIERCSTLEPSKVEECKTKVKKISQEKKDKAISQSPIAICEAIKFCQSLAAVKINKPTNKVESKRRCRDCKNFLNDVKEKEMASVASVGELIETEFCEKLSEDRQDKCEAFIETATEKEIELLDLVMLNVLPVDPSSPSVNVTCNHLSIKLGI